MIAIMIEDPADRLFARLFAEARPQRVTAGAALFHRGDPVTQAFWLERGAVALTRSSADGDAALLHRAEGPCWLAEASLFSESYHCDAVALTDGVVRSIPRGRFRVALSCDAPAGGASLALALVERLARELRDARARAERLTLRTVGERLDAWENACGPKPDGLPWARVAEEIGVSPEALYRELSKRRRGQVAR